MLAVSTDTVENNEKLARRKDIDFPLLADPELKVIEVYGLRHPGGGPYGDVARPATFILNSEGRIIWRELTDNWRVRVRPDAVLEQLRIIPQSQLREPPWGARKIEIKLITLEGALSFEGAGLRSSFCFESLAV